MGGGPLAVEKTAPNAYIHLIDQNRKWYNNSRLIRLNAWILLLLTTSYTTGYDGSMMNGLQSLDQWNDYFGHPTGSALGLLNAIQSLGSLLAFPISPYIADGLGRRPAIFIGSFICCVGTAVQTVSQSVVMFIIARLILGFGLSIAASAAPLLVTEIAYPTHRAPVTSAYNSLYYTGSIVAAWTTFGTFQIESTWSWRIPSALQALSSIVQVFLIYFCPESPRWLYSKGKDDEALQTLAYYHADGNRNDPLVQYEYEEIQTALASERDESSNAGGWAALVKTPGNRKRLMIIVALAVFSQWSGNGLAAAYLNITLDAVGIQDPTTQLLINGMLSIWNLCWALLAASLVEKAGRRTLFLISSCGMLLFFSSETVCYAVFAQSGNTIDSAAHGVIAFIFLFYAMYDLAFTPLIVSYTLEILPYAVRAKGFNLFNLAITLSVLFNTYINPIALESIGWKYYLVYVVVLMVEVMFLYTFLLETKGKSLEETAAMFDEPTLQKKSLEGNESNDTLLESSPVGLTKT